MFLKLYIVVVPCYSRLQSCCLAWRETFLHPEVSANSASQTALSRQARLARMEFFDSGKSLTCLACCSLELRWARWITWGSPGEKDGFCFCFSTLKTRCWLAGRAFAWVSLDARLENLQVLSFLTLCSNLGLSVEFLRNSKEITNRNTYMFKLNHIHNLGISMVENAKLSQ